ncbi:ABC transporter [Methanocella sp. MCL-LM]|uniref:ABC transporter n=1 Tax=Methanocella sp. MCL-LM TaxID=3412035 RepID=UPI003C790381
MNYLRLIRSFGAGDLLNVIRDPLLKWMIVVPFLIALVLRYVVPMITTWALPFIDLVPFYPMLMGLIVVMIPMFYGVCIGFLLLDERDEGTLAALKVSPVSTTQYLAYRITAPMIVSFVTTLIAYPIAGLTGIDLTTLVVVALVASLEGPFFALVFATFAENKVQGFAIQKLMGAILTVPLLAYLLDPKWEFVFYVVPTFWPIRAFWEGASGGPNFWLYVLGAIVVHIVLIGVLLKLFDRKMHRMS